MRSPNLLDDLPKMLESMSLGTERIRNISTSLRIFSRADTASKVSANLHEGIDSTLMILQHRLKAQDNRPAIQIIKQYGNIPEVKCYLGQLNQVFMNILANAIDAMESSNQGQSFADIEKKESAIAISTELTSNQQHVIIKIRDNGSGIPEEVKAHIFDHLFTTKEVGRGTGLGLSIAKQIVEKRHCGYLDVTSEVNQGTEFILTLPIT
jgi:signal transduction histidine kinase